MPGLPSLNLLSEETSAELAAHERRFDALDSKAGVLLGFSGVIVALTAVNLAGTLAHVGAAFAGIAAILSGAAFVPRRFPTLELFALRNAYLTAEEDFTRLRLLDTRIAMYRQVQQRLKWKARFVTISALALGLAVVLTVAASILVEKGASHEREHRVAPTGQVHR